MPLFLLLFLLLTACTAPQHPLTYVDPGDPVWKLNLDPAPTPQQATR